MSGEIRLQGHNMRARLNQIERSEAPGSPVRKAGLAVFDREAARYDAWFASERGRALFASEVSCLRHLAGGLPRPWLEVGVGTGRFAQALGIEVGVDPAPGALRYAAGRGVRALPALGEALPFGDGECGAVFAIVTLCFAGDPAALLREARRVVAGEGGVVLGIVPAESPWGCFYRERAAAGHLFYSQARFFTLSELKQVARSAGLRPERSASTLFQAPGRSRYEVESPREGENERAGFVAMLCRRVRPAGRGEPHGAGKERGSEALEPLLCMKDNMEIDPNDPRCPYPSSQCQFRELCPVQDAIRNRRRRGHD